MSRQITLQLDSPAISELVLGGSRMLSIDGVPNSSSYAKAMIDTTENWNIKKKYVPHRGEIIVYSDRSVIDGVYYPGIKIGDGMAYVVDLPFANSDIENAITELLNRHIGNANIHVTPEDKEFWNNKLNFAIDGEKLILNRE